MQFFVTLYDLKLNPLDPIEVKTLEFKPGWLCFETLSGKQFVVPSHRVHEVEERQ